MTKNKKMMISALPFVALVVLLAVFCGIVSSKGYRLDMYIKIVFNEGIVLSIVATGAIFIYTLGSFDISLGAATLFAATLGLHRRLLRQKVVRLVESVFQARL